MAIAFFSAIPIVQFSRHFAAGVSLDAAGMDTVQAARIFARSRKFSTNIVRPLLTARASVNGDGTAPDFAHPPLYVALLALALRLTHGDGANQGDRSAILSNMALYAACCALAYWLATLFFRGRPWHAQGNTVAALLFALGGAEVSQSVVVNPVLLAALLFSLLLIVFWGVRSYAEDDPGSAALPQYGRAVGAGLLFGLLFLSMYSALLILPAVLTYLYVAGGGRRRGAVMALVFVVAMGVVSSPLLARNYRLTHNPLYNSRLSELTMNTQSYPDLGLYAVTVPPRSLSQYLSSGGAAELAAKAAHTLAGDCVAAPTVLGLFVLPLFALSALSRFADRRVTRLRTLVYVSIGLHMLGLSFYVGTAESAVTLLVYAPFVAALSAGFLMNLVQARRLPTFYARTAVAGWTAVACLPGLMQILAAPIDPVAAAPLGVYAFLQTDSPDMAALRARGAYFASNTPEETAYRLDVPLVWLPQEGADMSTVTQRTGRGIGGVLLSADVARRPVDEGYDSQWVVTYRRIVSLIEVVSKLDPKLKNAVVKNIRLYYPTQLAAQLARFTPAPFAERGGDEYSLLLWNAEATAPASAPDHAGTKQPPGP